MFPTFISILDIQSWWEVPSIAHFCSLFRTAFNLLDFDIEDLEEALLTDGTEESSWLQELIVRLLSGCLPNNEISTFNYQMFLRRLFRQKCQEHDRYNPFNTDIDFQLLPLRTKVDILHALCDFRLDADDVLDQLKNLEADSLRVEPLGYDSNDSAYWYFYGTRLYREDFKTKNNKKKSVWQVICFTEDDWFQLNRKFKKSTVKCERQLYRTLTENFLPELPRLFREKERLARKRLLENQPRRTSQRLKKVENEKEEANVEVPKVTPEDEEKQKKRELEVKRREAYERRNRLKEQSEDSQSEKSEARYEMAGAKAKQKKSKGRQRKISNSSTNSKETNKGSKRKKSNENVSASSTSSSTPTTVGRQTNNSLAAATGQIVIQPVSNPHKKKLKTSQVFRQTDEDLIVGMHKILDYVKNHEDAWPFADPVDEDYAPNYYTVIRKPMDLQRMEERLDAGYYKSFSSFRNDFQLIVDNCRLYNGVENEYTEMVDNLQKAFERATEKFLDQISSSDDEIAVEYPELETDVIKETKKTKNETTTRNSSKCKPSLSAKTDKKRERSPSEESKLSDDFNKDDDDDDDFDKPIEKLVNNKKNESDRNSSNTKKLDKNNKKTQKSQKKEKEKVEVKKNVKEKKNVKNNKRKREKSVTKSPSRSRSKSRTPLKRSYSSSPPPSSVPSSPDNRFELYPKKRKVDEAKDSTSSKGKNKPKQEKYKDLYKEDKDDVEDVPPVKKQTDKSISPKPKDKHNKLRETIEKLKAKSEISNRLNDSEFDFELDTSKENKEKTKKKDKDDNKTVKNKKDKVKTTNSKKEFDYEDSNSTMESIVSEKKTKKNTKKDGAKDATIAALTLATEQTLKDINKWLDDTPKYTEYSSASNSPSYTGGLDEFDQLNKLDANNKKIEKNIVRKDNKDMKRRAFSRDPAKFLKRREIQRTIDRLQPGKSKGNLLSNVQNIKQTDELFPLGPLKSKDTKNSLIVKTDDNAPKLSLGSVLDSFGKHKFVDDTKKLDEEVNDEKIDKDDVLFNKVDKVEDVDKKVEKVEVKSVPEVEKKETPTTTVEDSTLSAGPTPNLSAWFKAFGAPKIQSATKKSDKTDGSKDEKIDEKLSSEKKDENPAGKTPVPEMSPNTDSPIAIHGQPIPRQRKVSTGSSVSERSSFSQDMDSPRVGIDERLGAYPAPYPSPLHRSPSGASPVMVSPRPDVSPKAAPYPPFNGQIRVGFYQDTVSTKSSPDKSCSPRDNPQSPYTHPEHVYTPNTTQSINYSYPNSPYYSHTPSYSNTNPNTPPYSSENINASYYDTNKSLTDQYQAKTNQNYSTSSANSPVNNVPSSPAQQNSPNVVDNYRQEDQIREKLAPQSAMFPVKKRAYNDTDRYDDVRNSEFISRSLQPIDQINVQSPRNEEHNIKQYVHQNIPEPKPLSVQTNIENYNKQPTSTLSPQQLPPPPVSSSTQHLPDVNGLRNYPPPPPNNPYNSYNDPNYPLNIPSRSLPTSTSEMERKLDMPKYTNMAYSSNPDGNFARNVPPQYSRPELNYNRTNQQHPPTSSNHQSLQQPDNLRFTESNLHHQISTYKNMDPQQAHQNYSQTTVTNNRNLQPQPPSSSTQSIDTTQSGYKSGEVSIPRPTYNNPHLESLEQPLGLRGNIANLSHIVDRYNNEERMLTTLQPPSSSAAAVAAAASQYYSDKGIGGPPPTHMFNKPTATSASGLPMFNQPMQSYNQNMQVPTSMYNRQMTELQNSINDANKSSNTAPIQEKKTKKRKSAKTSSAPIQHSEPTSATSTQGFQSYAGLKNNSSMEPSAISLKTASVVPGSAFNFGPTPAGLGIGSSLYADKDTYPNFLDDFRSAPNYYMAAAAAAHHRTTPETSDKQTRAAHQSSTPQPPSYPFIGAPQPRPPPSYPLGSPFMPSAQAQLMDASSPLYQHYIQAGVLNQGLLGPPGPYPPGYHALSMRQPYDSMTRPSWL